MSYFRLPLFATVLKKGWFVKVWHCGYMQKKLSQNYTLIFSFVRAGTSYLKYPADFGCIESLPNNCIRTYWLSYLNRAGPNNSLQLVCFASVAQLQANFLSTPRQEAFYCLTLYRDSNGKYTYFYKPEQFSTIFMIFDGGSSPSRWNSTVQRFRVWSCINCGGKLAHNRFFRNEKKASQKQFASTVINMAFADVMLGAVSLPLYIYLWAGPHFNL